MYDSIIKVIKIRIGISILLNSHLMVCDLLSCIETGSVAFLTRISASNACLRVLHRYNHGTYSLPKYHDELASKQARALLMRQSRYKNENCSVCVFGLQWCQHLFIGGIRVFIIDSGVLKH